MNRDDGMVVVGVERRHKGVRYPQAYSYARCGRCNHRVWLDYACHCTVMARNGYPTCVECMAELLTTIPDGEMEYLGMAGEGPPA